MKTISLSGPYPVMQALSDAIALYADAAYPPGGSDCAQAARAGLLDAATGINEQLVRGQPEIVISRRIMSHIKSAIQFQYQIYTDQDMQPDLAARRVASLLALLNGESIADDEWE